MIITYKFDKFDYTDHDIIIPKNTIFYRGIDHPVTEVLRDAPLYVASHEIAKHYGKHVYEIKTNRELKLIDFRKLKNLIRLIITSRTSCDKDCMQCIFYLTIAFGLCSYAKQVELLEKYLDYAKDLAVDAQQIQVVKARIDQMKSINLDKTPLNPFEPEGVRVAETYIDGHVVVIIKEMFKDIYDGFISPRLFSPFHEGNVTHEEIVIFNPKDCMELNQTKEKITIANISDLLNLFSSKVSIKYKTFFNRTIIMRGGASHQDKNTFFDDPQRVNQALSIAKTFTKSYSFSNKAYRKPNLQLHHPISFGNDC